MIQGMLLDSIHGLEKSPCLFWKKNWGLINKEFYPVWIVPLIDGWLYMNSYLDLKIMQDGAPGYAAQETLNELHEQGIISIQWPFYLPNLNPIETIWNKMKYWAQENHPRGENPSYDHPCFIVNEAWDKSFDSDTLREIMKMGEYCQAVIDAGGQHTI